MTEKTVRPHSVLRRAMLAGTVGVLGISPYADKRRKPLRYGRRGAELGKRQNVVVKLAGSASGAAKRVYRLA